MKMFLTIVSSAALALSTVPAFATDAPKPAAKAAACEGTKVSEVTLTGAFLCAHCNLHVANACAPMFQAEGKKDVVKICPASKDADKLTTVGKYGNEKVEVKGVLRKTASGEELEVVSYRVLPKA
ncbi:MAG: hypothetical protein ACHQPI_02295 [Thermoanaerobaculia bacterium]